MVQKTAGDSYRHRENSYTPLVSLWTLWHFCFFKQAAEIRQRATELYDRLRQDKQVAESSAIVASIEDVHLRSAVKAQLALHMSGLQPNAIDLGAFLSAPAASATLTRRCRSVSTVTQRKRQA